MKDDITGILDADRYLEHARDLSMLARHENKPSLYKSAYKIIEETWQKLQDAEEVLDKQYQGKYIRSSHRDDFIDTKFSVDLEKLDEDSHPAVLGLALPQLYKELLETREHVMKKHRRSGLEIDTSEYLSPQIDYFKDKDLN